MKITKPQLIQIIAEEVLKENVDLSSSSKVEELLGKLLLQLKKLDVSIDYLSSAFTGEDPWTIGTMQSTFGRARRAPGAATRSPQPAAAPVAPRRLKEQLENISRSRLEEIIKETLEKKV
jgi:hypothetical protein